MKKIVDNEKNQSKICLIFFERMSEYEKHNRGPDNSKNTGGTLLKEEGMWVSPGYQARRTAQYSTPQKNGCLGLFMRISTIGSSISSLLGYLGNKGIELAGNHPKISQIIKDIGSQLRNMV